jgi:hypothetical protein
MNTDGKELKSTEWTTFESPFKNDNSEDKKILRLTAVCRSAKFFLLIDKFLFRKKFYLVEKNRFRSPQLLQPPNVTGKLSQNCAEKLNRFRNKIKKALKKVKLLNRIFLYVILILGYCFSTFIYFKIGSPCLSKKFFGMRFNFQHYEYCNSFSFFKLSDDNILVGF